MAFEKLQKILIDEQTLGTFSTIPPPEVEGTNEVSVTLESGAGAWDITLLDRSSSDVMLVHQSKMAAFHLITESGVRLDTIERSIKDLLVKDGNYPLRNIAPSGYHYMADGTLMKGEKHFSDKVYSNMNLVSPIYSVSTGTTPITSSGAAPATATATPAAGPAPTSGY